MDLFGWDIGVVGMGVIIFMGSKMEAVNIGKPASNPGNDCIIARVKQRIARG